MLIDAARGALPERLETDVVVAGSGAAGIALALALAERNVSVVLVEAGGAKVSDAGQDHFRAASILPEHHGATHLYRRRAFGGTTAIWGGRCIPFDPIDFEERAWLPHARWPIGHGEVARFYPAALALCRAGPALFSAGEALPRRPADLVAGVPRDRLILDRIERFSEPTDFGRAYRRRLAKAPSATVILNAAVTAVTVDDDGGECRGVTARTEDGRTLAIRARRTVLAVGGLETVRLLLSHTGARSCGLGNERDLVGRFYQTHVDGEVGHLRFLRPPREVALDYERSPEGVYCRRYIWLAPDAQRRERLANLNLRPNHANIVDPDHRDPILSTMYLAKGLLLPEYRSKLTSSERRVRDAFAAAGRPLLARHVHNLLANPLRTARFAADLMRRRVLATRKLPSIVPRDPRNAYPVEINAEHCPDPDSRVRLGEERDRYGLPRLAIRWRFGADDRERVRRGMLVAQEALARSGAAVLDLGAMDEQLAELRRIGGHDMGTARMGDTPTEGVVDRNGRLFGTRGLYICGAATFPTSSFANPTLTIVALALRMAEHLRETRP